jgi:transposase-like protein
MTNIFALLFFVLTQLTVEQQLTEKYSPSKTNFKQPCPSCGSYHTIKNASAHHGKPKNQCKDWGRQFVINPSQKIVSEETKQLIDRLLLERISLRGIERVTGVSWSWLQNYVKVNC